MSKDREDYIVERDVPFSFTDMKKYSFYERSFLINSTRYIYIYIKEIRNIGTISSRFNNSQISNTKMVMYKLKKKKEREEKKIKEKKNKKKKIRAKLSERDKRQKKKKLAF